MPSNCVHEFDNRDKEQCELIESLPVEMCLIIICKVVLLHYEQPRSGVLCENLELKKYTSLTSYMHW